MKQICLLLQILLLGYNAMSYDKRNKNNTSQYSMALGLQPSGFRITGQGSRYTYLNNAVHIGILFRKRCYVGVYNVFERFTSTNLPRVNGYGVGLIMQYDWYNAGFTKVDKKFCLGSSTIIYQSQVKLSTINSLPLYIASDRPIYTYTFVLPLTLRVKFYHKLSADFAIGLRQAEHFTVRPSGKIGIRLDL
jgi:hypothetical protein